MTLIVVLAILAVCVIYFIGVQRSLVSLDEKRKNSLGQINAQLKSRWDAVTALAEMTKQYSEHEHDTLMDVINARRSGTVTSAKDVNAQNEAITEVMEKLNVVVERYPDLKANTVFTETMQNITKYEDNVRLSRMVYNDSVTKLNTKIRQFPSSIVANMLHFTTSDYIEEEKAKSDMPDIASIFKK